MHASSSRVIPDRPNRSLVVKCGYEGSSRRVIFPSAATCRYESLRTRVEECFALSASPFSLTYTDDDGETFAIQGEADLTEAIAYFVSGDDDGALSIRSGQQPPRTPTSQKITMRVEVIVEYDGPSLSDTSSISSFRSGLEGDSQSESSFQSSGYYTGSYRSGYTDARSQRNSMCEEPLSQGSTPVPSIADLELSESPIDTESISPFRDDRSSSATSHGPARGRTPIRQSSGDTATYAPPRPMTGPDSDQAPSLLTHSELGSRWLREQSKLATNRRMGPAINGNGRRYDSDEESLGSDDEGLGDIALVRDARGKYYYSYQTSDASSIISRSDIDWPGQRAPSRSITLSSSIPVTAEPSVFSEEDQAQPFPEYPVLAPDCSACGIRLDHMRYVCRSCGEGELWQENAPGKLPFGPQQPSESSASEGSGHTAGLARADSSGSQTAYDTKPRSRSQSISTNASRGSGTQEGGGTSPRETPADVADDTISPVKRRSLPRGYELCAGCIEVHGIAHSKAAAKEARSKLSSTEVRRRRKAGELRHTYREKIWGEEGWMDIEYSEDSSCTICRSPLFQNRYKCVSCAKFDLCRTCYQKVEEIHPAHAFLSLPDIMPAASSSTGSRTGDVVRKPLRHPGAFCHNCLQDIVGPRFHCAVCPSWDLCIQCEGLAGVGLGTGHTPDHIMMKIPVPLANNEVEVVSRRARDRWFQQDSNAVGVAGSSSSSRSSSPTNDTIYAGETSRMNGTSPIPPSQVVSIITRDALDHGCRCRNCNEWIMGRRYQCANCPSTPEPYNLCSICELRSYRVHDPRHLFFKLDRPVHIPLISAQPFLPLLYRSRVGEVPADITVNARDPTDYLKHVLHRETLCDIHSDQIRGIWLRCAHCAAGFDICQDAEQIADHDPTHVFVAFKARVNMTAFRDLADLGAVQSKPLLTNQVYLE